MTRSRASWALAVLATIALAAGSLLTYAEHTLFRSDAFADRAAASLDAVPVRAAAARQLTNGVLRVRPNLVALRPLIELGAQSLVGTPAFRALVRRAALDAHRAAFDVDSRTLTVRLRDAGVLVAAAVEAVRPDVARRIPTRLVVPVVRLKGKVDGLMLRLAERADDVRRGRSIAFGAALVLAIAALATGGSRRASMLRLGASVAVVGGLVALAAAIAPAAIGGDAMRAVLAVWLDPLVVWSLAASGAGLVTALAAVAVVRPLPVTATLRRAWDALAAAPRTGRGRVARAAVTIVLGAAILAWPRRALTGGTVALGAVLVLTAVWHLLALAAGPPDPRTPQPRRRGRGPGRATRGIPVAAVAAVLIGGSVAVAVAASNGETPALQGVQRCNGHAALCDRRVDQVAFLATHNSMAAAGEHGWLFAAQDAGISQQLDDGVRALLIDTHYGVQTARGVYTELGGKARSALVAQTSERFVAAAEQVRRRIGRAPTGRRAIYLCHTLCEVGATRALNALRAAHRFLVTHPDEVLVLSIQDETTSADTVALIRESGLIDEVYTGAARRPWPTLRELIDRDERVIVLAENHTGAAPWVHHQPAVVQETPYRFKTVAALDAPDSCRPNRGGTTGSLLLVNHWVDTSPAPRVTIARRVNAHVFLTRRLSLCRRTRGMPANLVAVDFYREGDAARVVDELNRVG